MLSEIQKGRNEIRSYNSEIDYQDCIKNISWLMFM